ncbi:MAG: mannitol dehydrogenase family protein [Actinobacteria bacterium]|nr:mannitol dehydrogenase family protein [Actinomycetota bacterium]
MTGPIQLNQRNLAAIGGLGIPVPEYERPLPSRIAHVGMGGFHRAHLAAYVDELAAAGAGWGITGLGVLDQDARIDAVLAAQDRLYTLIELGAGEPRARVIGSVADFVFAPPGNPAGAAAAIADPRTAIVSLTVTESGYGEPTDGEPTTFDRLAAALALRRATGGGPITVLSCDNLPDNGKAAARATRAAAARADDSLAAWIEANCTFPDSMVDRITPASSDRDRAWLRDAVGVEDAWPVVCEPFRQWVVEDDFAAGRPPFEDVGVLLTDRVADWERYKLRFLNAGHSCIAYLAALAGIALVPEAMATAELRAFLVGLLGEEAIPTVPEIPGHPRQEYVDTVVERFANPGIADQIARLCIDGSAKFPTFLIPTIEGQLERGGPVERAATALAGWARYLGTVERDRQAFDASGDAARDHAARALAEPLAFLEYEAVFPAAVRGSERFRAAFAAAYRRVAEDGPLAATPPGPAR